MLPALIRLLIFPLASLPDSSPGPMRRWSTEMITKVHYPENYIRVPVDKNSCF